MQTYMVQIITGQNFRDVYVSAKDDAGAIAAAKRVATSHEIRWASFVL